MSVLAWLTLAWAAVLVLAVAVSLTAIAVQLRRIGSLLGETREALALVRDRTSHLEAPLRLLRDGVGRLAGDMDAGLQRLRDEAERLEPQHLEDATPHSVTREIGSEPWS